MIFFSTLRGVGIGMESSMVLGITADIISHTRKKTGLFLSGTGNAGVSAAIKLGNGLGNVILGMGLSVAG